MDATIFKTFFQIGVAVAFSLFWFGVVPTLLLYKYVIKRK